MSLISTHATPEQIESLRRAIEIQLDTYELKARKNKKGAVWVQIILVISSMLTPIFLGWQEGPKLLKNFALVSSGATAALTTFLAFFDWKELWTKYKYSRNGLKGILLEIDFLSSSGAAGISTEDLNRLFLRFKETCANMDESYLTIRTDSTGNIPK